MTTIPGYILRREIASTLSAMGNRRFNITFRGRRAFTDGVNVNLPAIWPQSEYSDADAKVLRGYGNHEVFHPLYSTMVKRLPWIESVIGLPAAEMDKSQEHRLRVWLKTENCLDDWRIESIGAREFPGSHVNIGCTRNHIVSRELNQLQARDPSVPPRLIPNVHQALTWFGTIANAYPCAPTARVAIEFMRDYVDSEAIEIVDHYWPVVSRCRSNPELYPVALHLSDLLIRLSRERTQAHRPLDYQQESGTGAPNPAGPQSGDSLSGEKNSACSTAHGGSGSAANPGLSGNGGHPAVQSDDDDQLDLPLLDISDVVARIVTRTQIDVRAYNASVARAEATGRLPTHYRRAFSSPLIIAAESRQPEDGEAFRSVMENASRDAETLSAAVRSLLISRQRKVVRRHRLEGELDDQNIMGIAMGDPDIFRWTQRRTGTSAAVQLTLDASRSMLTTEEQPNGCQTDPKVRMSRRDVLLRAAGAVIEAIGHQRQIDLGIDSYTTDDQLNPTIVRHKAFGEPPSAMRPALGSVLRRRNGGTPTAEAILEGAHQLYRLKHDKKVLILITDGEANDPIAAEEAAHVAISCGIHLIGIGIGQQAPSMNIPGWLVINDVSELPIQLLEAVRRFL
ncbi:VWA domain-containing protein [Microvirga calopogonii]|uniref:VWA domain-containing protein n=1 Tax=Microvirga calopogonii TaxID=2078013 RepID=UPI000E0D187A|nr:vWA domain-containing protein [Microvirga calopogonii]